MADEGLITLNIDGKNIEAREGQTILEAAKASDVYIPSLCAYPDLEPLARVVPDEACQLCVVEANDTVVLACITPVSEG